MSRRIVGTAIQFLCGDKRRSRRRVCTIPALLLLLLALELVDSRKDFFFFCRCWWFCFCSGFKPWK
jgi:hypothetical protein